MNKINIEDVQRVAKEYRALNNLNIKDVEFYENDKKLNIPEEVLDYWRFTGLGLVHFVTDEFYKERPEDLPKFNLKCD